MRTTASYDIFPDAPSERALAKARYLAREGKVDDALAAYRGLMTDRPDVRLPWTEAFDLLRRSRRTEEALELAESAARHFPQDAFPHTLKGAALVDLNRYSDAFAALDIALERDPDLALTWHEVGNAAYRLGDRTRALMALDRAFSLEPHSETLRIRGRVLRDAGRYQAAEVSFEGAAQAAEHDEQRDESQREIEVTRRYALWAPRRPDKLTAGERWFADTGAVLLAAVPARTPPDDDTTVDTLFLLARDCRWRFGQLIVYGGSPSHHAWKALGERLGVAPERLGRLDLARQPLVVALRAAPGDAEWRALVQSVRGGEGLTFALEADSKIAPADTPDVAGALLESGAETRVSLACDPAHALAQAQHPSARVAHLSPGNRR